MSALSTFCEKKSNVNKARVQEKEQLKLILEKDLSIGDRSEKAPYTFSQIMPIRKDQPTIAVDENERIYVLDYKECHIKIFDRAGNHIKTFGRNGQGPGELEAPLSLSISNNNEIMVEDARIRRLHFFTLDGDYKSSVSTAIRFRMLKFNFDAHGNILCLNATNRATDILYEICLFDRQLNPIRTIASYIYPLSFSSMHVFTPMLHYSVYSDDSILYGFPDLYKLIIVDHYGHEVRSIEKEYSPIEVTAKELESFLKNFPSNANLRIPAFHNAYRYFTVDDKGRIFVQTWERSKNGRGYYQDIFDDTGEFIASIPLQVDPVLWKKNKLYTVEEDENGLQIMKRYKVLWQME
ncbi:MAG TPA: 6-bladed beta-propeller [Candidatus Aminicenantes bacterium]|nr:6-bladed beta-propeller [Candidatus Aminicenantes bacterium]